MSWTASLWIQSYAYATTGSKKKTKQTQNYYLPMLILTIMYWEIHQATGDQESPCNATAGIYTGMCALLYSDQIW